MQEVLGQGSKLSAAISTLSSSSHHPASDNNINPPTSSSPVNLRCPRCDSSNTKFCYYNNYNLTQPRHFCKTCRRYWTKGGALRNVPIGGGCRKNKTATTTTTARSSGGGAGRVKAVTASSTAYYGLHKHDELSPNDSDNPIVWPASSPHHLMSSSHILSLLRANQNPNPKPSAFPNPVTLKDESLMAGSQMMCLGSSSSMVGNGGLSTAPVDLTSNAYSRNNQQKNQQSGFLAVGREVQGLGLQEVHHQRLRPPTNCYTDQPGPLVLGSAASPSSSLMARTILEPAPFATGAEPGFLWNSFSTWSDMATAATDVLH